jgi:hypothetical protein
MQLTIPHSFYTSQTGDIDTYLNDNFAAVATVINDNISTDNINPTATITIERLINELPTSTINTSNISTRDITKNLGIYLNNDATNRLEVKDNSDGNIFIIDNLGDVTIMGNLNVTGVISSANDVDANLKGSVKADDDSVIIDKTTKAINATDATLNSVNSTSITATTAVIESVKGDIKADDDTVLVDATTKTVTASLTGDVNGSATKWGGSTKYVSDQEPTSGDGVDGDIWIRY